VQSMPGGPFPCARGGTHCVRRCDIVLPLFPKREPAILYGDRAPEPLLAVFSSQSI